jgi:hypothetical protein
VERTKADLDKSLVNVYRASSNIIATALQFDGGGKQREAPGSWLSFEGGDNEMGGRAKAMAFADVGTGCRLVATAGLPTALAGRGLD